MKSIQSFLFIGTLPVLLLTNAASARSSTSLVAPNAFVAAQGSSSKPAPTPTGDVRHVEANSGPCACFSTELIGTKVISTQGEKLGRIEDVVIHPNGDVGYAVLSFGGVMGLGDKYFAIPWSVLRTDSLVVRGTEKSKERALVLPLDKERLKKAPGFDKAHWPNLVNADWAAEVDTFYREGRENETERPVEAGAPAAGPIWRASDLEGFDVTTPAGEKLGDIHELAFDPSGHVCYAVLSIGGFLGIGRHLVAVPWDALKSSADPREEKRAITLSATKDRLEKAPPFVDDPDQRGKMCETAYIERIYQYFSARPYWTRVDDAKG
jgi:sporulation protein YlmC with PRC-barrel domain